MIAIDDNLTPQQEFKQVVYYWFYKGRDKNRTQYFRQVITTAIDDLI
jgi:hypothetical protein